MCSRSPDNPSNDNGSIRRLQGLRCSLSPERGLAILGCFTSERPVHGIAEVADELGMSRSTTHRYMVNLVALGYVERCTDRKYRLGLQMSDLDRKNHKADYKSNG